MKASSASNHLSVLALTGLGLLAMVAFGGFTWRLRGQRK